MNDIDDPFRSYRKMRLGGPAVYDETVGKWFVIGDQAARDVLTSDDFPVVDAARMDECAPGWRESSGDAHRYSLLPFTNPPAHTRLRRLVTRDLTVRKVERLRPVIEREAGRALDALAERGRNGAPADFLRLVAYPVTVAVIAALVGVPAQDWRSFREWSDDLVAMQDPRIGAEAKALADTAAKEFDEYVVALIAERRRRPQNDLISDYLAVQTNDPDQLTDTELLHSILILVLAGYVTTADSLGNAVHALLSHPEQFKRLHQEPSLIGGVVNETLRWASPVQIVQRYAAKDVRLDGLEIPGGSIVLVMPGAANRDPAGCPHADQFDIERDRGYGLAFGAGIHFCLGMALAKLELTTVLGRFAERFPNATFASPPIRRDTTGLAGFASLELNTGD